MAEILNYLADRVNIVSFLVGIIFIILSRFPAKEINPLYGYRTGASMRNQEIWDFSQKFSSVIMLKIGIVLFATSFLNSFINITQEQSLFLGIGLLILGCIYMCTVTERAIKKNFPNEK